MFKKIIISLLVGGLFLFSSTKRVMKKSLHEHTRKNRPFITVEYQGELGNKLFQTAVAIAYALDHDYRLIIPKKYLSSKSLRTVLRKLPFEDIPKNYEMILGQKPYIYESLPDIPNSCLKGFFISEKYFRKYRKNIQSLFAPPKRIKQVLQRKHPKIFTHLCPVGLHIRTFSKDRQGSNKSIYDIYPPPDLQYIQKALEMFPADALFVVCSDNIAWCKKTLQKIPKRSFYFVEGQRSFEDFYLLSLCKHLITSNSTFSWWAAYLISNPEKIIVSRSPWIKKIANNIEDIIPREWKIIEGENFPPIPEF